MTSSEPTSVAGSLIAALEQGGELVEAGKFSVDASQALVKLRDYQLVDPHRWVLFLIEASVLAGREPVTIQSVGEFEFYLGSLVLRRDELEELFAWVDGGAGEEWRRRRVLQQLALACNGLLGLRIDAVVIESIDHEGRGERLQLTPKQPLGVLESMTSSPSKSGTWVRVDGLRRYEREHELIRERCRYTNHHIRIGDERVSRGAAGAILDAEFEEQHARGGWAPSPRTKPLRDELGQTIGRYGKAYRIAAPPSLLIVSNGVLVERVALDASLEPNFMAVVELDLPRDLSQAKVRRGPEFEALVRVAEAAAKPKPKRSSGGVAAKANALELASGADVGPRIVYALMVTVGGFGCFFAFIAMLVGGRGAGSWLLGLGLVGLVGVIMLKRTES